MRGGVSGSVWSSWKYRRDTPMNCDQAKDIIALTRPGETAEPELRSLMEHLAECPDCTRLYLDAVALNENIAALRTVEPMLPDPDGLLRATMHAVAHTHQHHTVPGFLEALGGNHRDHPLNGRLLALA